MSVFKRGGVWWYKFYFGNKLIRQSAKTPSKTLAKEAEKQRHRELEEGYNGFAADRTKRVQTFSQAADELLEDYRLRREANSVRYLKQRLAHLKAHMGGMMLIEITPDVIVRVSEHPPEGRSTWEHHQRRGDVCASHHGRNRRRSTPEVEARGEAQASKE